MGAERLQSYLNRKSTTEQHFYPIMHFYSDGVVLNVKSLLT